MRISHVSSSPVERGLSFLGLASLSPSLPRRPAPPLHLLSSLLPLGIFSLVLPSLLCFFPRYSSSSLSPFLFILNYHLPRKISASFHILIPLYLFAWCCFSSQHLSVPDILSHSCLFASSWSPSLGYTFSERRYIVWVITVYSCSVPSRMSGT